MRILFKIIIYVIAIIGVSYLLIQVGSEIILQGAMLVLDIDERAMLEEHSGIASVVLWALIPEVTFGCIFGWELAGWLNEKINI